MVKRITRGRQTTPSRRARCLSACLLAGVATLTLAGTGPVQAQEAVSYTLSPASGPTGTTIAFEGTGCLPDGNPDRSDGRFEVFATVGAGVTGGSLLTGGEFNSNADGTFSGEVSRPIPDTAALGEHQTQVVCGNGRLQGGTFEVTAPDDSVSAETALVDEPSETTATPTTIRVASIPLARTGSSTNELAWLAALAVSAGGLLAVAARRHEA